jgi:hypothetical protein
MREDAAGVIPRPTGDSELGWARIVVHYQGDIIQGVPPIFEGAFSVNGVVHHIMTKDNYLRNRLTLDPELLSPLNDPDSNLVIWRDSDIMSGHEEQFARINTSLPNSSYQQSQTCGHDSLSFNTDPLLNPALRKAVSHPWYDPFGVLGIALHNESFAKRDDVAGGSMGTKSVTAIKALPTGGLNFPPVSQTQSAKMQGVRKVKRLYIWASPPIAAIHNSTEHSRMPPHRF